ncbi:hypothetical protein GCM10022263_05450 [Nocardioides daeguensis]|uniref:Uncharacterized protein n=1 Tax=Nocardioides daeguensis TaxID=908359 RepID=A0ABP6UTX1_9ACTN
MMKVGLSTEAHPAGVPTARISAQTRHKGPSVLFNRYSDRSMPSNPVRARTPGCDPEAFHNP